MKFISLFLLCLMLILLGSCDEAARVVSVEREDLFTLNIGVLEDQIALFNLDGSRGLSPTDIAMRDGLFYISDSNGAKILKFNSYGDILFMIYNEETNPPPLTLRPYSESALLTRWALPFPLLEPGLIAVNSQNHLFVQDLLHQDRHSYDLATMSMLDNIILHFDSDGRFIDFIGREGVGGTPFTRIEGLYTTIRDELVVICRFPGGWNIYWFDYNGAFLFLVQLNNEAIPIPADHDELIPSLDKIAVGPDSRKLFVKVDYYRNVFDESTNTRMGIEPDSSIVWIMNVEDGVWERQIYIPFFEYSYIEQNRVLTARMIYSFMGVISNERLFFSFPVDQGYSILILSSGSGESVMQHQGIIRVDNDEQQLNVFYLSEDGILSGLLAGDWQLKLVWWRTDRLLTETS